MAAKRTTIADIAGKLGVSMHTVNKALYGKKGVGDKLRAKILLTAKKMNYHANRVAQSMARRPMVIGVINHATEWLAVQKPFMTGIKSAIEQLRDYNTHGIYYQYSSIPERAAAVKQAIKDGMSVIICLHFVPTDEEADILSAAGIPFALLGTDGVEERRLTCVRADSIMAGKMAAELMCIALPKNAHIVAFTGSLNYRDNGDKIKGFTEELTAHGYRIPAVYEHSDQPKTAAKLTDEAFSARPATTGIYISTANGVPICDRIKTLKRKPFIIATDLYDEMRELLQQGTVKAVIYQNAIGQGRKIVEILYANICENKPVENRVFIPPSLVLPANMNVM